jgi:hypothetical protein
MALPAQASSPRPSTQGQPGRPPASASAGARPAGAVAHASIDMREATGQLPQLWSAERPALYILVLELRAGAGPGGSTDGDGGAAVEYESCQVSGSDCGGARVPLLVRAGVCTWRRSSLRLLSALYGVLERGSGA